MSNGLTRRDFLRAGAVGLVVLQLPAARAKAMGGGALPLSAFVAAGPGRRVTIALFHAEMGQGISTTLPAILADEIGADPDQVDLVVPDFDPAFRHPVYYWQFTGNSESIATYADIVRTAGAAAREMLIAAAATRLGVDAASLRAEGGQVTDGRQSLDFGDLAADAARLAPPAEPKLKPAALRRPLARRRIDVPAKVDGSAIFGIDVQVEGMLNAAVVIPPRSGARLGSLDEAAVLARPGVRQVVRLSTGGFAIVADRFWQAQAAIGSAAAVWTGGLDKDTAALRAGYEAALRDLPMRTLKAEGETPPQKPDISLTFLSPFQAHATMEPMTCTVHLTATACEIWLPTQAMELTHLTAVQQTGLPDEAVHIHRTYLGGGFGRRLLADFVKAAIEVAKATGTPVKCIWPRESDFAADAFRPMMLHEASATLGGDGLPLAIAHRVVSPSMLLYTWPRSSFPDMADVTEAIDPPEDYDVMPVEGLLEIPYAVPAQRLDFHRYRSEVPVSVWRTTGHGPNNWGLESLIDEAARTAGQEPLAYRRRLLVGNAPMLALLDELERSAALSTPPPPGEACGIALAQCYGSRIAQAVCLRLDGRAVRFLKVTSVVDLGEVLDEDIARQNVEGGVVWGLSALRTEVGFEAGAPTVTNFDGFDPFHLWETPAIETHFVSSGGRPGGVGEVGPVPLLAAACNALRALTGERITELPLSKAGFSFA